MEFRQEAWNTRLKRVYVDYKRCLQVVFFPVQASRSSTSFTQKEISFNLSLCSSFTLAPSIQAGFGTSPTSTWTPPTTWPQIPPRFATPPKEFLPPIPACTETSCATRRTASSSPPSPTWHRSHSQRTSSYGPGRYTPRVGFRGLCCAACRNHTSGFTCSCHSAAAVTYLCVKV